MRTIKHVINPMMLDVGTRNRARVFFSIKTHESNFLGHVSDHLSITGVIGPNRGGNCRGGAGQINMEFREKHAWIKPEHITFLPGWDTETFNRFLDVWDMWHLKKDVPEDILSFLEGLPITRVTPAWV